MKTILRVTDQVNCRFEGLDPLTRRNMVEDMKFFVPGARFTPAYKLGRWDGRKSFATVGGSTYINLLDRVLPKIIEAGYEVEIEDEREHVKFDFPEVDEFTLSETVWPEGHPFAGDPIILREHQVRAIQTYFDNPQSIQEIATSAGKCLVGETEMYFEIDEGSAFAEFMNTRFLYITYERFVEKIEEFLGIKLVDHKELNIKKLRVRVPTPTGLQLVNYVIKKEQLPTIKVKLSSGLTFTGADGHIVIGEQGEDTKLDELKLGHEITTRDGLDEVILLDHMGEQDCYDIGINKPHVYYDASGIKHHNTIITGALSKLVEGFGRTITIVPSKSLVTQTFDDYENLGLDAGVFYGDKKQVGKQHTIMTWQSLLSVWKNRHNYKPGAVTMEDMIDGVVAVIVDEAHSGKSKELSDMLGGPLANIPLRWGLTGTIPKDELDRLTLLSMIGPVVGGVTAKELQEKGIIANLKIHIKELDDSRLKFTNYQDEKAFLVTDTDRLEFLSGEIINMASTSGNTLVLVERIETGEKLQEMIPGSVFLSGSAKNDERREEFASIQESDNKVLIASYGIASTGISIPRIFNLVLLEPGKSFIRVIQSIGRGIRIAKDKDFVDVYDFSSNLKYSAKHMKERKKFYESAKYPFEVTKIKYK